MDELGEAGAGGGINWREVATTAAIAVVVAGAIWWFTIGRQTAANNGRASAGGVA